MDELKRYSVIVTRDTTESTVIEVQARDEGQAQEFAIERSHMHGYVWTKDDTPNASKDHYTNGAEEV